MAGRGVVSPFAKVEVILDHDPWENPSDDDEDLYSDPGTIAPATFRRLESVTLRPNFALRSGSTTGRPSSRVFSAFLTEEQLENAPIKILEIDVETETAVLSNETEDEISLEGWYCKSRASGKSSAPFGSTAMIQAGSSVTLWMAPSMAGSNAPLDDNADNILWRNKQNGKLRRLRVLSKGGDALELFDADDKVVHFKQV